MEAIGRLAGGIAHDFNNVLTTIIGYSDLLLASTAAASESVKDDINEIRAAAERASALTKGILAFSRRQTLQPRVLSLNSILSDTERMLARTLGADITLRVVADEQLGLVEVDEHQFVQVLLNLAVNARDAMPGGGMLTIATANAELSDDFCRLHPDAAPGRYVKVSVTDTGTGMDAETAAHVFEPFYTTKAPGRGDRLGALDRVRRYRAERGLHGRDDRTRPGDILRHLPTALRSRRGAAWGWGAGHENNATDDPSRGR